MMVIASAASFGSQSCRRCWIGHTTAMMNKAAASGANTWLAWDNAAEISTAAMIPMAALDPKLTPMTGPFDRSAAQECQESGTAASIRGRPCERRDPYAVTQR